MDIAAMKRMITLEKNKTRQIESMTLEVLKIMEKYDFEVCYTVLSNELQWTILHGLMNK